ncbi:MAG: hypothetical protein L0Z53_27530 [Acidobacteriales bacterium]|nr:hypothetical protein [Terriglobales bacterium]
MLPKIGLRSIAACLLIIACQQIAFAKERDNSALGELEKVILFAVQLEAKASNFETKKDLCVGFGYRLKVNEKAILTHLRRNGLEVHSNQWCIRDWPRGFSISVHAAVKATVPGTYELVMDAADLYIKPGEHVATILAQGNIRDSL